MPTSVNHGLGFFRAQARLFSRRSHRDLCRASLLVRLSARLCSSRLSALPSGSGGHPPAGLMAECTAEQSLGRRGTLPAACLVHRRSVVMT